MAAAVAEAVLRQLAVLALVGVALAVLRSLAVLAQPKAAPVVLAQPKAVLVVAHSAEEALLHLLSRRSSSAATARTSPSPLKPTYERVPSSR